MEVNNSEEIAAFTSLLVENAGGIVRIPIDKVEEFLPKAMNHTLEIRWEDEDLVFEIKELNAEQ